MFPYYIQIMGSTCMGKPRPKIEIMHQKSIPQKRYINYESNKVKKQMVVGQSEGAHIKINKSLITCSICMQNYNTTARQPVIACSNHHTYCRQCLATVSSSSRKCPECRNQLIALVRNRDIYLLVDDNRKQLEQNGLQPIKEEQTTFMTLTVDQKNKFLNIFWIQGNRVMKIEDNFVWQGFISNETVPRDKECTFTIRIISSKFNNIQMGVVGQGYQVQKNLTCKQSVVYHVADGMILEGVPGRNSQWKAKGQKIAPGTPVTIETKVNIPKKTISWYHEEKQLGKARLSDYVLNHQCVAYILMSHTQDIIQLNA